MTIANLEHGNPASASAGAAARAASGPAAALSIVSIVIPVFNEGENLRELVARIDAAITPTGRPFELILVDDGSTDDSRAVLAQLARDHNWLRPLLLIRNYGQSTALQAGFDHVRGELVVTLDGDLQNEPAEIPRLLEVPVRHHPRTRGSSKYGIDRVFRVLLDLLWVTFMMRFLHRPLHAFGAVGSVLIALGSVLLLYLAVDKLVLGHPIGGRPLLVLGALLTLIGVQLLATGVLGELLTRVYHEPQGRRQYVLRGPDEGA